MTREISRPEYSIPQMSAVDGLKLKGTLCNFCLTSYLQSYTADVNLSLVLIPMFLCHCISIGQTWEAYWGQHYQRQCLSLHKYLQIPYWMTEWQNPQMNSNQVQLVVGTYTHGRRTPLTPPTNSTQNWEVQNVLQNVPRQFVTLCR